MSLPCHGSPSYSAAHTSTTLHPKECGSPATCLLCPYFPTSFKILLSQAFYSPTNPSILCSFTEALINLPPGLNTTQTHQFLLGTGGLFQLYFLAMEDGEDVN